MATLSGAWTIRAIQKTGTAVLKQGVSLTGSVMHNAIFELAAGDEINNVRGEHVDVTLVYLDQSSGDWKESLQREVYAWQDEIGLTLTISGDDNAGSADFDFDDLIVLCVPETKALQTPLTFPRLDLTIPKQFLGRARGRVRWPGELTAEDRKGLLAELKSSRSRKPL